MMQHDSPVKPIWGMNLSIAWTNAFIRCFRSNGAVSLPGIVHFSVNSGLWDLETQEIRNIHDKALLDLHLGNSTTNQAEMVAGTIFPETIWKRCKGDRHQLYQSYEKIWPRVRRYPQNHRGTYFNRLISYDNQLEKIITTWEKGIHRLSALQASIFDPNKDHISAPLLGFPCLQQIVFHPMGTNGKDGLRVVAFYAMQHLLEKGYGNYLGLYRLGDFMAKQMGIELKEVMCIAAKLKMSSNISKRECEPLFTRLNEILSKDV